MSEQDLVDLMHVTLDDYSTHIARLRAVVFDLAAYLPDEAVRDDYDRAVAAKMREVLDATK